MATVIANIFNHIPILTIIYLMPLIAVISMFLIPGTNHRAIKIVSLVFSVISFILALLLFFAYDFNTGGMQFVEKHEWLASLGINYFMGVNGINVVLVLLTGIIITAGILASWLSTVNRSTAQRSQDKVFTPW